MHVEESSFEIFDTSIKDLQMPFSMFFLVHVLHVQIFLVSKFNFVMCFGCHAL